MPDMRAYPRYLPRYPISDMKNPHPIRFRYPILRTLKMSLYLKALGIHVYFATIKDSYCLNGKNLEANAKAIHALKSTLNDEYLSRVANFDLAFVVWNTIVSLGEQK